MDLFSVHDKKYYSRKGLIAEGFCSKTSFSYRSYLGRNSSKDGLDLENPCNNRHDMDSNLNKH